MFKRILFVSLCLTTGGANASGMDIGISDETAKIMYLTHTSALGLTKRAANADTRQRIEGADVAFGAFFNSNDDYIALMEVMVKSQPTSSAGPIQFGLGFRGSYGSLGIDEDSSLGNISIGGEVNFRPPFARKAALTGGVFYSPKILSFADSEKLLEYSVDIKFELVPSSILYFGYRNITLDTPSVKDLELEDNFHIGVRLTF